MAYFGFDTIYGHYNGHNEHDITIHHIISFILIFYSYNSNKYGLETIWALVQGEVTSLILNTSRALKVIDIFGQLSFALDLLFLFVFLTVRPTTFYLTLINIQKNEDTDLIFKIFPAGLFYLSMDWCWMIVNKAAKILHTVIFFLILKKNFKNVFRVIRRMKD